MAATKNAHDWHCEDHDTYGWRGEACPMCPKARGETEVIEQLEARQATDLHEGEHKVSDFNDPVTEAEWWAKGRIEQLEAENKRLLTVAKQARLVLRNGKGKADSLSIVAAKLCDKVLVPNQAEHSIDLQVAALQAEVERLKAIPMKYRRLEFNAQLQNENDELRNRIEELEADLATSRELKQIWQSKANQLEAANKRLRDALEDCAGWLQFDHQPEKIARINANAVLAATEPMPEAAAQLDGYRELEAKVAALEAENSTLRGHIEQLREAVEEGLSTYKVPMTARICEAITALAATDPPIGDRGILDGSNRKILKSRGTPRWKRTRRRRA